MKLTTRLSLYFFVFSFLPILVLGFFIYDYGRKVIEQNMATHLSSTTIYKQAEFERWINNSAEKLALLAQRPQVQDFTASLMIADPEGVIYKVAHHSLLTTHLQPNLRDQNYLELYIIEPQNGEIVLATEKELEGKFRENESYFLEGRNGTYIDSVKYLPSEGKAAMHISTPVYDQQGNLEAVLVGHVNLDILSTIMRQGSEQNQNEETYMINTANFFVTKPWLADVNVLKDTNRTEGVTACLQGISDVSSYVDYRGVDVIGAYRWLPESNLCVITEVNEETALQPVSRLRLQMIALGLVASCLMAFLGYWVAISFTLPINSLVNGTARIGEGDLKYRISLNRSDELGTLGEAFNQMASSLETSQTQLRDWAAELEKRVTERTTELSKSEERYRTLTETSPDLIYVIDPQDNVIYINNKSEEIFGKSPEDIIGHPRSDMFPDGVNKDPGAGIKKVFQTGKSYATETVISYPEGDKWFEARLVPLYDESDEVIAVLGVSRDVTERKKFTAAIQAEKEFSDSIINSLPGIFYMFGDDQSFIRWNKNFEQVTGYSAQEIEVSHPTAFFSENDKDMIADRIKQIFLQGDSVVVEADLITKDGQMIPYILTGLRIGVEGEPRLIGVGMDITSRKRAEEELAAKSDALERSNKELENFAYVASHDLQEPLRMINSYLQLLVRRYREKLDGDALEFIDYAVDGSTRMKQLINDLLVYSRVNTATKEFAPTDLEEVLQNTVKNLQVVIEENQTEITHDRLPTVIADDVQMGSLFQNLIGNAIKYHGEEVPRIHIGVSDHRHEWQFSFKDNGIGIAPQYFERVFVIFQRLHSRDAYSGTGIGLSVSKRIVERHGGHIWIESQPGQGSTFYFTLPKNRKEIIK